MQRILSPVLLGLCVVLFTVACPKKEHASYTGTASTDTAATTTSSTTTSTAASGTITYVAPDPGVFQPAATIDGWVSANPINNAAINQHAWDLWAAITKDSGQTLNGTPLPVWETWYDTTEVYRTNQTASNANATAHFKAVAAMKNANPKRRLHPPVQSLHHGSLRRSATPSTTQTSTDPEPGALGSALVLTFNRFTREMYDHVGTNNYWQASTLTNINNQFNTSNTPIAQRVIQNFPSTSVMMKPVFVVVSGTQPTMLPYWNGVTPETTTNLQNPKWDTWKQCVLVDPTGKAKNDQDRPCNGTTLKAGSYQVVPVSTTPAQSAFYAFQITQTEVDDMNAFTDIFFVAGGIQKPKAGDYAVFVASHVSTREIDNWTWQTFWWQPDPSKLASEPPNALSPPPNIARPWNNYAACTAYYMVTPANDPNGKPHRCYNPYLETDLTGLFNQPQTKTFPGITSNCMSCHRAASWPQGGQGDVYATTFLLDPSDPKWFANKTKLDFAWSMADFAH